MIAAMVAACTLLLTLVRRHVPAEGLLPWLRESFRSVRQDQASDVATTASTAVDDQTGDVTTTASTAVEDQPTRVADLMELGEDGPAYHQARDLRDLVGRRRTPR